MQCWVIRSNADLGCELEAIVSMIQDGGIVAVPTGSSYALAADISCADALERVQRLKGRGPEKPLLALVPTVVAARQLAPTASSLLEQIAARFWPGPLTLLMPAAADLAPPLVSATGLVAVRVPGTAVTRRIAGRVGGLSGTSANRTGEPAATTVDALQLEPGGLAGTVDVGPTRANRPSTLVDITREPARILRHGAVSETDLRQFLGSRLL